MEIIPSWESLSGFPRLLPLSVKDPNLSHTVPLTYYPKWLGTCFPVLHFAWRTPTQPSSLGLNATFSKKPSMISSLPFHPGLSLLESSH